VNGFLRSKGVEQKPDLLSDEALEELERFEAEYG